MEQIHRKNSAVLNPESWFPDVHIGHKVKADRFAAAGKMRDT
jgi:hypothetical protein